MTPKNGKTHSALVHMALYAMFGAMLFVSKVITEALPNIHPVTMLIMTLTVVYGWRALIPVYVFVAISGVYYGFAAWWIPYLYLWATYVALTMCLPKNMKSKTAVIVYPLVCGLFGLLYGTLYAPVQALLYGYNLSTTMKWIVSGLPFDALHALGNFGTGFLIFPLSHLVQKLEKKTEKR